MEDTQILDLTQDINDVGQQSEIVMAGWLDVNGSRYELNKGVTQIGRDNMVCKIALKNEKTLSKVHAQFEVHNDSSITLMDLGSRNRSRISKMILKPQVQYALQGGEVLQFGSVKTTFIKYYAVSDTESGSISDSFLDKSPSGKKSKTSDASDSSDDNDVISPTPQISNKNIESNLILGRPSLDFIPETPFSSHIVRKTVYSSSSSVDVSAKDGPLMVLESPTTQSTPFYRNNATSHSAFKAFTTTPEEISPIGVKYDSLNTIEERKIDKEVSGFAKYPIEKYDLDASVGSTSEFKSVKETTTPYSHKLSFDIEQEFGDDTQEVLKAFEVDSIQDDTDNGDNTQDIVSAFEKPGQQIPDDDESVYAAETQVPSNSNDEEIFKRPVILPLKSLDDVYDAPTQVYSPVKSRADITRDKSPAVRKDRSCSLGESKDVIDCQFSINNNERDDIFDAPTQVFSPVKFKPKADITSDESPTVRQSCFLRESKEVIDSQLSINNNEIDDIFEAPTQVFSNVIESSSEVDSATKIGDVKCIDSTLLNSSKLSLPLHKDMTKDIYDAPTQVFDCNSPKRSSTERDSNITSFSDDIYVGPTQILEPFSTASNRESLRNESDSSIESEKDFDRSKLTDISSEFKESVEAKNCDSEFCDKVRSTKKLSDSYSNFHDYDVPTQIFDQSNCDVSTQIFNKSTNFVNSPDSNSKHEEELSSSTLGGSIEGEATLLFDENNYCTSHFPKIEKSTMQTVSLMNKHSLNDNKLDTSLDDAEPTQIFDDANFSLSNAFAESKIKQFRNNKLVIKNGCVNEEIDNSDREVDNEFDESARLLEEQGEIDSNPPSPSIMSDPPSPSIIPLEANSSQNGKSCEAHSNQSHESSFSDDTSENFPVIPKDIWNQSDNKVDGETSNSVLATNDAPYSNSLSEGSVMSQLRYTDESNINSAGVAPSSLFTEASKQDQNFEGFPSKIRSDDNGMGATSEFGSTVEPDECRKQSVSRVQAKSDFNSCNDSNFKCEIFATIKTEEKEPDFISQNIANNLSNEQIAIISSGGECTEKSKLSTEISTTLLTCDSISTANNFDGRGNKLFSFGSDKSFDGFLSESDDINGSSKLNSLKKSKIKVEQFGQIESICQNKKNENEDIKDSSDFKGLIKSNDLSKLENSTSLVDNNVEESSTNLSLPLNPLLKEKNNSSIKSLYMDQIASCSDVASLDVESLLEENVEKDNSHVPSYSCISTNKENISKFSNQQDKILKRSDIAKIVKKEEKFDGVIDSGDEDCTRRNTRTRSNKRTNSTEPVIVKTRSGRLSKASSRYSTIGVIDVNPSNKSKKKRSLEQNVETTSSHFEYSKKKPVNNEIISPLLEQHSPLLEEICSLPRERIKLETPLPSSNLITDRARNEGKGAKSSNKLRIEDFTSRGDENNVILDNSNSDSICDSHSRQPRRRGNRKVTSTNLTRRSTRSDISEQSNSKNTNERTLDSSKVINLDSHVDSTKTVRSTRSKTMKNTSVSDNSAKAVRSTRSKTMEITSVSDNSTLFTGFKSSSDIVLQDSSINKPTRSSKRKKDFQDINEFKATSTTIPCLRNSEPNITDKQDPGSDILMAHKGNSRKKSNRTQDSETSSISSICSTILEGEIKKESSSMKNKKSLRSSSRKENVSTNATRLSPLSIGGARVSGVKRQKTRSLRSSSPVSTRSVRSSLRGNSPSLDPAFVLSSPVHRQLSATKLPRVLFTSYKDTKDEKIIRSLGGIIAESVSECSVLVVDGIRRTCKFLACLAKGIPIVSPEWITATKTAGGFVDPWQYIVTDNESEKKFEFSLIRSLKVASRKRLLTGYSIYVTDSVKPPPEQMIEIIECSGGEYLESPPTLSSSNSVVISCSEDKQQWSTFRKRKLNIVSAEFILTGILKQQIMIDEFNLK